MKYFLILLFYYFPNIRNESCLRSVSESLFHTVSETLRAYGLPHEPQFQTVHFASTLDGLISGVQTCVVELVLLEQVGGVGTVAAHQQVLVREKA